MNYKIIQDKQKVLKRIEGRLGGMKNIHYLNSRIDYITAKQILGQ